MCFIGCPRQAGRGCTAQVKGDGAEWTNHGSAEKPTLTPSYNCVGGCGWHGYVVDGKTIDAPAGGVSTLHVCANCQHPEIQTVHVGIKPMGEGRIGAEVKLSKTIVRAPGVPQEGK